MIHKLPRWVWSCAWVLAFIAGMINVVGLLGFEHQGITHLTGTTSMLGASLADGNFTAAWHVFTIVASFVTGTAVSGFLIQDSALKIGRRYGLALFLESLALVCAVPLLQHQNPFGLYFAAGACGLQNAMATTYSGSVIRTTHVSGMFTDLGIFIGHTLRGLSVDRLRLRLCGIIISGFLVGGIAGAAGFRHVSYAVLYVPAALTGLAAIIYSLLQLRQK